MISGVSTASLFMREMNEDALTVLNDLGVRSTEIFLTTLSEYGEEFARLLASRKGSLQVNSVHLLNTQFEPQLFGGHPRAKADAFGILRGAMASAHIFGARYYTFHGITRLKKNSVPPDAGRVAASLSEISGVCAEYGVTLSLENVHWALYNRPGSFPRSPRAFSRPSRRLRRKAGPPFLLSLSDVYPRHGRVHLARASFRCGRKGKRSVFPGAACSDFEECFRRLKEAGFDGAALIEVYAGRLRRLCRASPARAIIWTRHLQDRLSGLERHFCRGKAVALRADEKNLLFCAEELTDLFFCFTMKYSGERPFRVNQEVL